ncbi:MAG: YbjN domain-containing protein [Thermoplasmata archaeon]|nr:YbjN domain-containing protein [Thermoplasmata archaeon]
MFGRSTGEKAMRNARAALDRLNLKYEVQDGTVVLSAMGDDLPIGMLIMADDENLTLNIYCYLMFEIPADARRRLVPELNTINNTINNGGFYMADEEDRIYFKIVQSYYDSVPSVDTIAHLITIAFKTVDVNDGRLHGLIPEDAIKKDLMYS